VNLDVSVVVGGVAVLLWCFLALAFVKKRKTDTKKAKFKAAIRKSVAPLRLPPPPSREEWAQALTDARTAAETLAASRPRPPLMPPLPSPPRRTATRDTSAIEDMHRQNQESLNQFINEMLRITGRTADEFANDMTRSSSMSLSFRRVYCDTPEKEQPEKPKPPPSPPSPPTAWDRILKDDE